MNELVDLQIEIERSQDKYQIYIGTDLLKDIESLIEFEEYSQYAVLTDTNVEALWLPNLEDILGPNFIDVVVDAGEKSKNIANVQKIWKELLNKGFDRKSLLINLGGGMITDLGGYAASTYMRGIDFINIPTTLLCQVDASVGGKTGINFAHRKNMVGTFTHPQAVIIDVNTLSTLPKKEISSGLAEAIKHGLIKDEEYLTFLEDIDPENITDDDFVSIVKRSCEIKASVVQEDEKESGLRKILNFGHTIGHAIEALSLDTDNHLLHGEAISIGMVAEAHLSMQEGFISNSELARIEKALQRFSLPARTKKIFHQEVLSMIKSDKKNEEGSIKWTLLKNLGEASFDNHCHEYQIIKSLNYILI